MASAFALISVVNYWRAGRIWPWTVLATAILITIGFLYPRVLQGPNRLWFKFGLLLHHFTSPVILGLVFYCGIMPTGLIMRMMGKDMLGLKRNLEHDSYWITRRSRGPTSGSMKDQF